jgi:hypothetical protein
MRFNASHTPYERQPPFQVEINGKMQDCRYNTLEEAKASVKRIDVNIVIYEGRKVVYRNTI